VIPHHLFVGAEGAPHLAFLLHGVLGAGHNFRSFAKRLNDARPDIRFALIDLRYHGRRSLRHPPTRSPPAPRTWMTSRATLERPHPS
jgi:pimeloyl-ACP methyl ester carboxylesterase